MRRVRSDGRPGWSERIAALAVVALLFLNHMLLGANKERTAYVLMACAGLLLCVLLTLRWAREGLAGRMATLAWVAAPFALAVLLGARPLWLWLAGTDTGALGLDVATDTREVVRLLGLACLFLAGAALGASVRRGEFVLNLIVWASGLYAAWAVASFRLAPHALLGGAKAMFADRLTGSFVSPNSAAALFGMGAILAAAAVAQALRASSSAAGGRANRLGAVGPQAAALLACLLALILTASRTALATTTVVLLAFALAEALTRRVRVSPLAAVGLAGAVVAGVALMALSGGAVMARLGALEWADRMQIVSAHWGAFVRAPVWGYGLGSFDAVNKHVVDQDTYGSLWSVRAAHNVVVQWLEEGGLVVALPMFAAITAALALILVGAVRRTRGVAWVRGVLALSVGLLLHGMTDYALQVPSLAAQWALLLGLGVAMATHGERAASPSRAPRRIRRAVSTASAEPLL